MEYICCRHKKYIREEGKTETKGEINEEREKGMKKYIKDDGRKY
jgi:hypothetical protein